MAEGTRTVYGFGAFRFDAAERVLYRDGSVVPVTPKVADTLLVLLERHGQLVEKSELLGLVWPGTFVEEGGLARNISVLRKTLGDEPDGCHYIETIPKRGYRFVAEVREIPSQPEAAGSAGCPDTETALAGPIVGFQALSGFCKDSGRTLTASSC